MIRLPALVIILGFLVSSTLGCGITSASYQDESIDVAPLSASTFTVTMSKGKILEGYVTVRGGDDDIKFFVKDSYGNIVLNIDVRGRYDISYTANSDGFHTLYFDNGFSLFTRKQVLMHYRVR